MCKKLGNVAVAAALLAMGQTQAAQAAKPVPCIAPREMNGLVAYFLPSVLTEISTQCAPHLPEESYLKQEFQGLVDTLEQEKEASWPLAKAAFFKVADGKDVSEMKKLSDKSLRPLVDELLASKLGGGLAIKPKDCSEINDIVESLAPLSPGQTVHFVATVFNAVARSDKQLRSCPRVTE